MINNPFLEKVINIDRINNFFLLFHRSKWVSIWKIWIVSIINQKHHLLTGVLISRGEVTLLIISIEEFHMLLRHNRHVDILIVLLEGPILESIFIRLIFLFSFFSFLSFVQNVFFIFFI